MFRSNTRFLKYKLTYTNFFRIKTILRLRRTTFKVYLSIISIWVSLFQASKHRYNFLQSYSIFSISLYLPFINPILNNLTQISNTLNYYPLIPTPSINKIFSMGNSYLRKNGSGGKIKINKLKKLPYPRFLLILQFPYNIIESLKIKNYNELVQPTLLIRLNSLILSVNKVNQISKNSLQKNIKKPLVTIIIQLILYIISLYRKVFTYNILRSVNYL